MTAPQAVAYAYLGEFHTPSTRSAAFVWAAVFPGIGLIYLPGMFLSGRNRVAVFQ